MIYERIRNERATQGITLDALAARTGIAASNLSRLEQGRVDARFSTIDRVLGGLGLEMALVSMERTSLSDIQDRMAKGADRLVMAGLAGRDVPARLDWKKERGLDTTVERRVIGTADGPG